MQPEASNQSPATSPRTPVYQQTLSSIRAAYQGGNQEAVTDYTPTSSALQESNLFPGQYRPLPEETVLEWQALSRPFKKRDRQFYTTITAIVFLVSLILFFAGQFLPIALVVSVGFLMYVLNSVPPTSITNKITTYGIRHGDNLYYWEELGRFWFETKFGYKMVLIEIMRFPGRVILLLGDHSQEEMTRILSEVLLKQKPEPTFLDKAADWLKKTFPLEK